MSQRVRECWKMLVVWMIKGGGYGSLLNGKLGLGAAPLERSCVLGMDSQSYDSEEARRAII